MFSYHPPLEDMAFALLAQLDAPAVLAELPPYGEVDADLMRSVLAQAGRFASDVLQPLNATGDRQGCRLDHGDVRTPDGYPQAYRRFWQDGWPALACDPDWGGQGLPQVLNALLFEMLAAANHGWTMYPGLLHGAYEAIKAHGSDALKRDYLEKIATGEWLAAMALTEPQAGSDLGLVRTRAEPQADGSHRVSGSKIFISGADHDLTDNIVHLVLARLPDAPAGTRGLSLFLVSKFLPGADGRPGTGPRNAIHIDAIEHKMGLHGSATCAVRYDGAIGWLVGEPHRGLAAMFVMMNAARLHVAMQGLGHTEVAYQNANAYATERLQMRAVVRPADATGPADPIARHPPVARALATQRAWAQGGRALACWAALELDIADHHPDPDRRARAQTLCALATPVLKAMLTDNGLACANQALQLYGGYGYVRETGIEQVVRDVRVALIYEGTNEIQAIDLLVKKVVPDGGARLGQLLALIEADVAAARGSGPDGSTPAASVWPQLAGRLSREVDRLRALAARIVVAAAHDPALPHRVATDFLRLLGLAMTAWMWLGAARACEGGAVARVGLPADLVAAKLATARHFFDVVLPEGEALAAVMGNLIEAAGQPLTV